MYLYCKLCDQLTALSAWMEEPTCTQCNGPLEVLYTLEEAEQELSRWATPDGHRIKSEFMDDYDLWLEGVFSNPVSDQDTEQDESQDNPGDREGW